jgi:hypothetical protein
MKRPSIQFYFGDWRSNAKLRRCTWAQRGVWLEVMGLMHDSDWYGVLQWPLRDIAQAVGCPLSILQALAARDVMKGADPGQRCTAYTFTPTHAGQSGEPVILIPEQDGPLWYSSRMVLDEYLRQRRGGDTRYSREKQPNRSPKPGFGDTPKGGNGEGFGGGSGDGASSSSSSSSSKATKTMSADADGAFLKFYEAYPRHTRKAAALKAWRKLNPDHGLLEAILNAIEQQKQTEQWRKDGGQYIPHPATWLNDRRWEDEVSPAKKPVDTSCRRVLPGTSDRCGMQGEPDPVYGYLCDHHRRQDEEALRTNKIPTAVREQLRDIVPSLKRAAS